MALPRTKPPTRAHAVTVLREELEKYRETSERLNDPSVRRVLLALRDPERVRRLLEEST